MTGKLPGQASVVLPLGGTKLFAPSAERNVEPITRLLLEHAPKRGRALEIASGTGQHVVAFARAMPGMTFHPTDVAPDRLASIDAYSAEAKLSNVAAARELDATRPGWGKDAEPFDLVVLVNLLHLVGTEVAWTILREAAVGLKPGGLFLLYGPFRRDGRLTSEGDAQFDADLRRANPDIGYKDDVEVERRLRVNGLSVVRAEMPANNLAMIAKRSRTGTVSAG